MMQRGSISKVTLALCGLGLMLAPAWAEGWSVSTEDRWCHESRHDEGYCEVRETTLRSVPGTLSVLPGMNGGVSVEGWDRGEILVQAKVTVWSRGRSSNAKATAADVEVFTGGGEIRAEGPERSGRRGENWSVSFRLRVPHDSDLLLETHNGGISIRDVRGEIRFEAMNGGVSLDGLAGDVRGRTMNGGLSVKLDGCEWDGEGLDVKTTNGGVKLAIPEGYNAELTTGTVNGKIRTEIPIMVEGDLSKRLRTTLGRGGAPVSVVTTNGGVKLVER